jgi:hypothetical protein
MRIFATADSLYSDVVPYGCLKVHLGGGIVIECNRRAIDHPPRPFVSLI